MNKNAKLGGTYANSKNKIRWTKKGTYSLEMKYCKHDNTAKDRKILKNILKIIGQ